MMYFVCWQIRHTVFPRGQPTFQAYSAFNSRITALVSADLTVGIACNVQSALCNLQSAICIVQSGLYYIHKECGLEVLYTVLVLPSIQYCTQIPAHWETHPNYTVQCYKLYNILYRPLYRLYWANLGLNRPLLAYIPRPIHIGMGYLALGLSMYVTLYRVQTLYSCTLI